jgi:hypothetical protein
LKFVLFLDDFANYVKSFDKSGEFIKASSWLEKALKTELSNRKAANHGVNLLNDDTSALAGIKSVFHDGFWSEMYGRSNSKTPVFIIGMMR